MSVDGTIVIPMQTTRADGVDPDAAVAPIERAIFSHPGRLFMYESPSWISQVDVKLAKVVVMYDVLMSAVAIEVHINHSMVGYVNLINNTMPRKAIAGQDNAEGFLPANTVLLADVDQLTVIAGDSALNGAVSNLSVFVSFEPAG